jgi:hypothetical protein
VQFKICRRKILKYWQTAEIYIKVKFHSQ